jgi:hypothetical protein
MQLVDMIDMQSYSQLPHLPASYLNTNDTDESVGDSSAGTQHSMRSQGTLQCDLTPITNVHPSATIKWHFDALGKELKALTKDSEGRP